MAAHLLLFASSQVESVLAANEEVWAADPRQQADLLMTILARGLPMQTVSIFCKESGADIEKIITVRGSSLGRRSLSKREVRAIRGLQGKIMQKEAARRYGVDCRVIRKIWKQT